MLIGAREIESLWSHIIEGRGGEGGERGRGGKSSFFMQRKKTYFSSGNFYFALEFQLDFITLGSFHSETISMLSPRLSSTNLVV